MKIKDLREFINRPEYDDGEVVIVVTKVEDSRDRYTLEMSKGFIKSLKDIDDIVGPSTIINDTGLKKGPATSVKESKVSVKTITRSISKGDLIPSP